MSQFIVHAVLFVEPSWLMPQGYHFSSDQVVSRWPQFCGTTSTCTKLFQKSISLRSSFRFCFCFVPFGFNLQQVHHPIWFILVSFYWHCENDSAKLDHKHLPLFTPSPYARIHSPWWSLWNPSAPLVVFMTCDGGEPWALFACFVEGKLGPCQQVETFLLQACNQPRLETEMKKTWSC